MTPNHAEQKDRARAEAEHHLAHSAVDRMRESNMNKGIMADAVTNAGDEKRLREIPDVNNAYPGEV